MRVGRAAGWIVALLAVAVSGAAAENTYGTTATSYKSVAPNQFLPVNSPATFNVVYTLDISGGTYSYWVDLPSGALISAIEWDYCDDDGGGAPTFGIFRLTRAGSENGGSVLNPAFYPAGCRTIVQDVTAGNFVVDNHDHRLIMYLAPTETVRFAGAVIDYKLQVSPSPATATFGDVPTTDFAFQYIEALVASGVTGGCGGGNYCPDSFVTRRQMAIFLAKSLGLHWP